MTNKEITDLFWHKDLKIENLVLLASCATGESTTQALSDIFEHLEDKENIEELFGIPAPDCLDEYENDYESLDFMGAISEWLYIHNKLGFVGCFYTPIKEEKNKITSYSWGYCSVKYFYAETIDDLLQKGLAWVEELNKEEQ